MADLFRARGIKLHLLTSGLFLEKFAEPIAARFEQVTISLDGSTRGLYQEIRGVDALALVERGVACLEKAAPALPIRARSTLHRHNFAELPRLIDKAKQMRLAQISFLTADVTSEAFGRRNMVRYTGAAAGRMPGTRIFGVVEDCIRSTRARISISHFIAESPEKLRRLPKYYAAQLGLATFPRLRAMRRGRARSWRQTAQCDRAISTRRWEISERRSWGQILSEEMVTFRRGLNVEENQTCRKCVCTLKVGMRSKIW